VTPSTRRSPPTTYRLLVRGHLDQHWSHWFGDLALAHESGGTTSLTGVISDQAALHGLLAKIRDLGVVLISMDVVAPASDGSRPTGRTP
jgi:hypothetical protein